ncbi:hypothetical protein EVAR_64608_1 [Eumeta japonica]|uniref:Uncharacterized protein n=1 Tax=Eumeta variegata TaxID=151549 RepID=A0A4C1Z9M8_EUMVA|nr:hypothetical protein EVAR_64608_1 [Eumeta japonica]
MRNFMLQASVPPVQSEPVDLSLKSRSAGAGESGGRRLRLCAGDPRTRLRHLSVVRQSRSRNATEKKGGTGSVIPAQYIIRSQIRAANFRNYLLHKLQNGGLKMAPKRECTLDAADPHEDPSAGGRPRFNALVLWRRRRTPFSMGSTDLDRSHYSCYTIELR